MMKESKERVLARRETGIVGGNRAALKPETWSLAAKWLGCRYRSFARRPRRRQSWPITASKLTHSHCINIILLALVAVPLKYLAAILINILGTLHWHCYSIYTIYPPVFLVLLWFYRKVNFYTDLYLCRFGSIKHSVIDRLCFGGFFRLALRYFVWLKRERLDFMPSSYYCSVIEVN